MTEPLRSVNGTDRQRAARAVIGWLLEDDLAVDSLMLEISDSRRTDPHAFVQFVLALIELGGIVSLHVHAGDRDGAAEWVQQGLLTLIAQQEGGQP